MGHMRWPLPSVPPGVLLLLLAACQDYDLKGTDTDPVGPDETGLPEDTHSAVDDRACTTLAADAVTVPLSDTCSYSIGGFEPIVEWDLPGELSSGLPVVADLNGDGKPEVIIIMWDPWFDGRLRVYHGDGSGLVWENAVDSMGFGSAPAVADLDGDGRPEVISERSYTGILAMNPEHAVVAYSWDGRLLWESEHFLDNEFDYATGISVSDMDHDGSPEIVAGRAILNADGSTRAIGMYDSRGAPMGSGGFVSEGAFSAVADLDLDGEEELITGNTKYDPDGNVLWRDSRVSDGAVAIANLDDDPEGEMVVVNGNTIRAQDTDGTVMWGPLVNAQANIFPVPAIGDIDADGSPDIIVAGGNTLWALRADGSMMWSHPITDMTGATGAAIFDFDADGIPEVVYIDEVEMIAFNGADGAVKFHSNEHGSDTMYDYPVIADVDADGHAEILVAHDGYSTGLSVYGDATNSWAPVRKVWNQHAYSITNINDDLSVPVTAVQNFTLYNSFHSALAAPPGETLNAEIQSEILEVCTDDCDMGTLRVLVRIENTGSSDLEPGVMVSLYARTGTTNTLLGTATIPDLVASGMTSVGVEIAADAALVAGADSLLVVADDDGTGTGHVPECLEDNNTSPYTGALCP